MPFAVDELGAWLLDKLADAGSRKLIEFLLGGEQERALHQACRAALAETAAELYPADAVAADHFAMVIREVFKTPAPGDSGVHTTLLEELQSGIAVQLAVLDNRDITAEPGCSSADALGVPVALMAARLASHLVREIVGRGVRGGPLEPLANQLGHDRSFLMGLRLEGGLNQALVTLMAIVETTSAAATSIAALTHAGAAREAHAAPAYLRQVESIAPATLLGREPELDELAAFCTEPGRGPYVWWQGSRSVGKTALMSWFVLHPPPAVRVVSFFVTSSWAGEDDHRAFTDAVTEQLAELLGQPAPRNLRETTRGYHLLQMLSHGAEACRQQNEQLVLVVDGLDEDRGAAADPDIHSIAAMLPLLPPAGLRIIVAGRAHPPLPDDVPDDHPLQSPHTLRSLKQSPWALTAEKNMRSELARLLHGDQLGRQLLGFLAAAGGGLSASDLAELTGESEYYIHAKLNSVEGRALDRRPNRWRQPGTSPEIFILGHEVLREAAVAAIGGLRLATHRDRLHAWSDEYRRQGWPRGTPEYLFRGYVRLLRDSADMDRLLAWATDRALQDRMLVVTGGDAAALAGIAVARECFAVTDSDPDLVALGRLALSQNRLAHRNQEVPADLPVAWLMLGQRQRAEALAEGIADPVARARALAALAAALAASDPIRAHALARDGRETARQDSSDILQRFALRAVADDLVLASFWEEALQAAGDIRDRRGRSQALLAMATGMASVDKERAVTVAASAQDAARDLGPEDSAPILLGVAEFLAKAGSLDAAEQVARSIRDEAARARAMAAVAVAVAPVDRQRADALVQRIERIFLLNGPEEGAVASAALYVVLAQLNENCINPPVDQGEREDAEQQETAEPAATLDSYGLASALATAASMVAETDGEYANELADSALQTAQAIEDSVHRSHQAYAVAEQLITARFWEHAEEAAASIDEGGMRSSVLRQLVEGLVAVGQFDRANRIAQDVPDAGQALRARLALAEGLIVAGHREEAEAVARSMPASYSRARALSKLAVSLAGTDRDRALKVADEAEQSARTAPASFNQSRVLSAVAQALADTDPARARAVAARAEHLVRSRERLPPYGLGTALAALAAAFSAVDTEQGITLATEAVQVASAILGDLDQHLALQAVIEELVAARLWEPARLAARSLRNSDQRAYALTDVAVEVAKTDDQLAQLVIADAEQVARTSPNLFVQGLVLREVARRLAAGKLWKPAARIARSIGDPGIRADTLFAVAAARAKANRCAAEPLAAEAEQLNKETAARPGFTPPPIAAVLARGDRKRILAMAIEMQQTVQTMSDAREQSRTLALVAGWLTAAESWEQAEQVALSVDDLDQRDLSLSALARGLAEAELWAAAERVARNISHPATRERTLCKLLDGLGACCRDRSSKRSLDSREDPSGSHQVMCRQARGLVADLLGTQDWLRALRTLGQLSPAELAAVGEYYLVE